VSAGNGCSATSNSRSADARRRGGPPHPCRVVPVAAGPRSSSSWPPWSPTWTTGPICPAFGRIRSSTSASGARPPPETPRPSCAATTRHSPPTSSCRAGCGTGSPRSANRPAAAWRSPTSGSPMTLAPSGSHRNPTGNQPAGAHLVALQPGRRASLLSWARSETRGRDGVVPPSRCRALRRRTRRWALLGRPGELLRIAERAARRMRGRRRGLAGETCPASSSTSTSTAPRRRAGPQPGRAADEPASRRHLVGNAPVAARWTAEKRMRSCSRRTRSPCSWRSSSW
jgi:hypothetical protein